EFLGGAKQPDPFLGMQRSKVGASRQPQHLAGRLVDVRGALRNGGVRTGHPRRSARARFEALPQADFEIGEATVGPLAVTQIRLELRVRLEPKRGAEQPAARFLDGESGADDL